MPRRLMSHETSGSREKDGDRLVYEPLERKWAGYHARHCGCGRDWLEAHAVPAGFTVIPRGKTGYYGLVGPGLTEGVDEEKLTANALWEAVTGKPGTQTWYESVHITCRSPQSEAARKDRSSASSMAFASRCRITAVSIAVRFGSSARSR